MKDDEKEILLQSEINIENLSDNDSIRQMLEWEAMRSLEHQQKNLNMQENVAVITAGTSLEVKQHLTSNYPKIREALHCLCAEGPSKLHFGLMLPMSIVQQAKIGAAPRVILISDGRITGHTDGPNFPDEREKLAV
ncbi:hypothetical protein DPMN_119710 [Dreissena polymorpha]|uniref:Uncharacterized protein n=1 Tax=Dreissena polymorpha TaxID=45954 RepID=A0A9D4GME1_DREPO|nr:hypothetical protein DPMN_119710 [Dreissena polymorpha]